MRAVHIQSFQPRVILGVAIYELERRQVVRMSLEECWRFFSDPRNLARITPPELHFVVRSKNLPGEIHPGLIIRYTVSPLLRIPMSWVSEITQVRRLEYFVDEQRAGPYRFWHHEHFFRAIDEARTEVRDLVHYAPPFGPIGAVMNALAIRRQLQRIFDFRERQLNALCMSSLSL